MQQECCSILNRILIESTFTAIEIVQFSSVLHAYCSPRTVRNCTLTLHVVMNQVKLCPSNEHPHLGYTSLSLVTVENGSCVRAHIVYYYRTIQKIHRRDRCHALTHNCAETHLDGEAGALCLSVGHHFSLWLFGSMDVTWQTYYVHDTYILEECRALGGEAEWSACACRRTCMEQLHSHDCTVTGQWA